MFLILFLMCKIYCLPKKKIVKKENVTKSKITIYTNNNILYWTHYKKKDM